MFLMFDLGIGLYITCHSLIISNHLALFRVGSSPIHTGANAPCTIAAVDQRRRIFGRKIESRHLSHQGEDEEYSREFRADRSADLAKLQFAKRGLDPQDVTASVDGSAGVSAALLGCR